MLSTYALCLLGKWQFPSRGPCWAPHCSCGMEGSQGLEGRPQHLPARGCHWLVGERYRWESSVQSWWSLLWLVGVCLGVLGQGELALEWWQISQGVVLRCQRFPCPGGISWPRGPLSPHYSVSRTGVRGAEPPLPCNLLPAPGPGIQRRVR